MSSKKTLIILSTAVLIVTLAEIFNLTTISLWHDESFSALLVKYDFSEMIARIKMDVHPPLYYIFLRGWSDIFSNSLFSIRMFSVFFSVLAIFTVYIFTNQAFKNRGLSLFSSLLYAISYFQVQYAMEARMYSLGTFLVILGSFFFLKALESGKIKWWLMYSAAVILGIYTHYFAAFWVLSQAIYLIYLVIKESKFRISDWLKNKNLKRAFLAYFLVFISYIPWLPTFFKQLNQVQEDYWITKMSIWSIPNTFSKMTSGAVVDAAKDWHILALLMAFIVYLTILFLKRTQSQTKWYVFSLLFLPFFATALLSLKRSIYIDRYFIFGFPFYLIICAGAILSISKSSARKVLIAMALAGICVTFPYQWNCLEAEKKPGMAAAAKYVNENAKPDEKIFVGSSLIYFTFKYYNQTGIPSKLYAPGFMPHYSGTALLSNKDIITDFNNETGQKDVVWMVNTTGFGNFQPAVPENWEKLEEKGFEEVNAYQGWIVVSKYAVE